jgi:DeoR family fructose operon transcriptional repressor
MTAEERKYRLESYLQKVEFASLEELARQVGVSVSTARRDLNLLEVGGTVRRTHGGARVVNPHSDEFTFSARDTHQLAEKEAIGRVCAELIEPRQSVVVDAGTTAYHVAKYLEGQTLQIITNSLPVANLFASSQRVEVVVSGGVLYPRLGVMVGPLAVKTFAEIHADVAIMSAGGITLEGLTNSHALLIDIQRTMIESARRVIFCLDHTKFDRKSVAFLCDLESIDTIVTDSVAPQELIGALREKGLTVLVADLESTQLAQTATDASPPPVPGRAVTIPVRKEPQPFGNRLSEGQSGQSPSFSDETANVVTWD